MTDKPSKKPIPKRKGPGRTRSRGESKAKTPEEKKKALTKDLDKTLKDTKFGGKDANPRYDAIPGGNKPWSIRNSVRYLARQQIDRKNPAKSFEDLLGNKPTISQLIAANTLAKATKADMRAVEYATDQIDGKLAQTNINADFAAIQGMSDDELQRIVNGVDSASEGGGGED